MSHFNQYNETPKVRTNGESVNQQETDQLGNLQTTQGTFATRVDEASGTVTYVGQAPTGTATSAALWQIQKIDTSSGTAVTWADGDAGFDNVWDDRATLTYS
jgi:hypothetical protein